MYDNIPENYRAAYDFYCNGEQHTSEYEEENY